MPNQPSARERILLAFETLLIDEGGRAATLDAVAAAAGVSKGGLLYHFKSRDALTTGLIHKLSELADADFAKMREAPEGPAEYYIRTSVFAGTAFDRTLVAATRLAQGQEPQVSEAFTAMQSRWMELICDEVRDAGIARAILLIGDGLYYNAALFGGPHGQQDRGEEAATGNLLHVVRLLKGQSAGGVHRPRQC
ncbi:TetR/AcrR family transcriptional regulator [Arthrobacter sp. H14-L1]|uniref:TetR/AcrR family transcriptional regulator n=1 Tax=Arthrobacter sp. H14-L1 TaxID=2996697 RepID=UPI00226E9ACC|nr:TetR/AcrR family transcriptional regulator [Arthrobacter sp. H14-L1]MCY0904522.1 TetR family transcriptional regulator [Arthrobacter sp. H14-L1]